MQMLRILKTIKSFFGQLKETHQEGIFLFKVL